MPLGQMVTEASAIDWLECVAVTERHPRHDSLAKGTNTFHCVASLFIYTKDRGTCVSSAANPKLRLAITGGPKCTSRRGG